MSFVNSRKSELLTLAGAMTLLVALCFQGIDLADEGFWMANAKFFFSNPESVLYCFSYYFSVLTTAVWGKYVSDTMLSYRILAAIVRWLTILLAYLCLRKFLDRRSLLIGLIWGLLLSIGYTNVLYGSMYTALFYVCIASLLFSGTIDLMEEGKERPGCRASVKLILGALLAGVSAYVRIPNITALGFFLVPYVGLFIYKCNRVDVALKVTLALVFGWLSGFALVTLVMVGLGHLECFGIMLEMFREIAKGGHHSVGLLIMVQLRYYMIVLAWGAVTVGFGCAGIWLLSRMTVIQSASLRSKIIELVVWAGLICLLTVCILGFFHRVSRFIPVGLFLIAFVIEFFGGRNPQHRVLWFTALVLLGIQPLGSDVPFEANSFALPFIMPLCADAYLSFDGLIRKTIPRFGDAQIGNRLVKGTVSTLVLAIALCAVYDVVRDNRNRFLLNTTVRIHEYCGLLTTKERARAIENIVQAARKIIPSESPLVVFPGMSSLYAILEKPPALECSRANLYSVSTLEKAFRKGAERNGGNWPYVIEEKWHTGWHTWPKDRKVYIPPSHKAYPFYLCYRSVIKERNYEKVWEDDDFVIWRPRQPGGVE